MRLKVIITREGYGILECDGELIAAASEPDPVVQLAIHAAAGADEPRFELHPHV